MRIDHPFLGIATHDAAQSGWTPDQSPLLASAIAERDVVQAQSRVEEKRWISEADYKEGIALAQLAPGPLAECSNLNLRS